MNPFKIQIDFDCGVNSSSWDASILEAVLYEYLSDIELKDGDKTIMLKATLILVQKNGKHETNHFKPGTRVFVPDVTNLKKNAR